MSLQKVKKIQKLNFFFCPAADYLNQYNETGSHGQIAYQFMNHLAKKQIVEKMFAATIMSLRVAPIVKTKIVAFITKKANAGLEAYDSLYFYIGSYVKYLFSKAYKDADIVHHIIPYAFGYSFNFFFIFKNPSKKYVLGPIIGPHINTTITADEQYVFVKKNLVKNLQQNILSFGKTLFLGVFGKVLYYLSKKTLQQADIVLFSDNHASNYHKKFMLPSQKGFVLDTGIDTDVFKPASKKRLKNIKEPIRVLFVGRLTVRKGCEYLIQALAVARSIKKDIKIQCSILGIGPLQQELENLVKKLNISDMVTFLGGVKSNEEIVPLYHACDIVCLPALSETFTVAKEAMASGKPVIITRVGSHAERVKEDIDGFVVEPKDSKAIAKVLVKLAENPKKIDSLSENALRTRHLYDWDNITDMYVKMIA